MTMPLEAPALLVSGTFVHTPCLGELEILEDYLLAVDNKGYVSALEPLTSTLAQELLAFSPDEVQHERLPQHAFLLPTYTDTHVHAPQYLYAGTGLDLPLMQWLEGYAFRAEERIDGDEELAEKVYHRLGKRMIEQGTGTALLFGTIKAESNLILARIFLSFGIRSYIGKLSMDQNSQPSYIEPSSAECLAAASEFIHSLRGLTKSLPAHRRLIHPVITPRFVPTCSDETLQGLGRLAKEEGVRIQSHMCEARDQVDWVRSTRGMEDEDVFEKTGLLGPSTTQAHCTFLKPENISRMASLGSSIAHCPLSNAYFSSKSLPLRECLDASIPVGLGSDIAGGYSLDLATQMRQAVITSRIRDSAEREARILPNGDSSSTQACPERDLRVNWKEALFLATRGGAMALKEPGVGGRFAVGEAFDAQRIILAAENGAGIGALDLFDLEAGELVAWEELVERWWCQGVKENRTGVWVQGRRLL